jgi:hypothetical protein
MCAVRALAKGWSKSRPVHELVREILFTVASYGGCVRVAWHDRESTMTAIIADLLSHGDLQAARKALPALNNIHLETISQTAITNKLKTPHGMKIDLQLRQQQQRD